MLRNRFAGDENRNLDQDFVPSRSGDLFVLYDHVSSVCVVVSIMIDQKKETSTLLGML